MIFFMVSFIKKSRLSLGTSLIAAAVISGCAQSTAYLPKTTRQPVYISQATLMTERSGDDLYYCSKWWDGYQYSSLPKGDSLKTLRKIDELVKSRFRYQKEDIDSWNPAIDTILGTHDLFEGDCDDLATTTVAIAICAGVPPEKLGMAVTSTDGGADANHMVSFYKADDGTLYALGDTMGGVRPMKSTQNRVLYWTYMDDDSWWGEDGSVDLTTIPKI